MKIERATALAARRVKRVGDRDAYAVPVQYITVHPKLYRTVIRLDGSVRLPSN